MIRRLSATAAALAIAAAPAMAVDTYTIDQTHSEATFQVRHLVTKVRGRFTDFQGNIQVVPTRPEASSIEFVVRAASIDTGLAERDKHLRSADFFDVEKYPEITFRSRRIAAKGKNRYGVTGLLSLRGISKEITLPVTFLGFVKDPWGNEKAGFETAVTLNRKDFGIVWNAALDNGGFVLGNDVLVSISLETVRKKDLASK